MKVKKLKKKSVYKMFVLMLTASVASTTIGFDSIVRAATDKDDFIKTIVTYNDEMTQANVKFEIDSLDKEKYELTSIISDKEGTVIYDKTKAMEENKPVVYETTENGSYKFIVKYVEKQKKEVKTIEESIKETKVETGVEGDISKEIKEVSEKNKDTIDKSAEKKEEQKVPEKTLVKKEKFTQVIVDVTDIKLYNTSEETIIDVNSNLDSKLDSATENKNEVNEEISNINENNIERSNQIVNLTDEFFIGGVRKTESGSYESISSSYYSITNNRISLGKEDDENYKFQTILLTNKNSIDYNKDFEISGKVNLLNMPEGFAIAFHNTPNYNSTNSGGSFGIYRDYRDYESAKSNGLDRGLIVEIDTFNNVDNNYAYYGDKGHPEGGDRRHLAINRTNEFGDVTNLTSYYEYNNKYIYPLLNKDTPFKVSWKANENKITFQLANLKIETINNEIGDKLKSSPGYYTISTGINYNFGDKRGKNSIVVNEFKYTNVEPSIKTNFKAEKSYAIPGETVTVTHEIKNNIESEQSSSDKLNLIKMKIDDVGDNLKISNIRTGTDLNNLTKVDEGIIFDSNNSLDVIYPANSQPYYVQYDISIPALKNYGSTNQLNYNVLLGQKGMTQISSNGSFEIRNRPSLETKKDGQTKDTFDVFNVSNVEDITPNAFWQEFYAKTAIGTETKLLIENNNTNDINIKWRYSENLSSVNSLPTNIEKGKIYSLYIEVSDKNDPRLTNVFRRYIVVSDHIYTDGEYYIYGSDSTSISETKLVTLSEQEFKEYVKANTKSGAIKHVKDGNMQMKAVDVDTTDWLDNNDIPYRLPGEHKINLYVSEKPTVKLQAEQDVTENTWSYDTKDRTEANGASGFIVIPKSINMSVGSGKDELVADGDIFFANYNAKYIRYKVYVDKKFELTKTDDTSNKINVTSSFPGAEDKGNNRLFIDTINFRYNKDNPLTINFKAARSEENKIKGRWNGNVTFYFERVN